MLTARQAQDRATLLIRQTADRRSLRVLAGEHELVLLGAQGPGTRALVVQFAGPTAWITYGLGVATSVSIENDEGILDLVDVVEAVLGGAAWESLQFQDGEATTVGFRIDGERFQQVLKVPPGVTALEHRIDPLEAN